MTASQRRVTTGATELRRRLDGPRRCGSVSTRRRPTDHNWLRELAATPSVVRQFGPRRAAILSEEVDEQPRNQQNIEARNLDIQETGNLRGWSIENISLLCTVQPAVQLVSGTAICAASFFFLDLHIPNEKRGQKLPSRGEWQEKKLDQGGSPSPVVAQATK